MGVGQGTVILIWEGKELLINCRSTCVWAHFPMLPGPMLSSVSLWFPALSIWVFPLRPVPGPIPCGFCLSLLHWVSRVWQGGSCPGCCLGRCPVALLHLFLPTCSLKLLWPRLGPGGRLLWDAVHMPNLMDRSIGTCQPCTGSSAAVALPWPLPVAWQNSVCANTAPAASTTTNATIYHHQCHQQSSYTPSSSSAQF